MKFDILDYAEANLDGTRPVASRSGSEVTACCPECGGFGSFYVNTDSGAYVCFKCELRGRSIVGLVAHVEGISWSDARAFIFKRSVKLRRKSGLFSLMDRVRAIRPHAHEDGEASPPSEVDLPPEFRPCYRDGSWSLPVYLKDRRIKSSTARAWGLGWCRTGRYASRLVIPIDCPGGRSFTARDMTDALWPKYLNPTEAHHSDLLIGWNMAPLAGDLVIVEGPLDAVKLWQHSVPAVALGGHELHDAQRNQLMALSEDAAITIMLDPEEREAPLETAARLACHFKFIYIASLPAGVDPGSSTRAQAHEAMDSARRWTGGRGERVRARLHKAMDSAKARHG